MEKFDGIVSLLIACIELLFVINLLIFAEKNSVNKLVIALIGLLFGYQFFETLICTFKLQNQFIIYLAFFGITFMPPLGFYTVQKIVGNNSKNNILIFIPALFFISYYPFVIDQFAVTKCTVLYASYHYPLGQLYAVFYYLPILFLMVLLNKKWGAETSPRKKSLIRTFFFGYLFTFIPAMIIALTVPSFINAVESLLCKMAFILASFLTYFCLKNKTEK
ncbi:MAG: hypothetical protein HYS25_02285 [Ignavibacteriales bacterium]|nr:hypothetical protein [Ignavibacteriales bacterium]